LSGYEQLPLITSINIMARILFIDDDTLTLQLMQRITGLLGHEAILCSTAAEAFKMAVDEKPGLILVDFSLTDSDGIEVIQNLHRQPITAHIPILVLSAGITSKTAEAAKKAGAQGCLEKPLSLDLLSQVIKNYASN